MQKRRGFILSERAGYGGEDHIEHVLWSCEFARKVWGKLNGLCMELTGVKVLSYNIVMFGLCSMGRERDRIQWLLMACVKEVLWDIRNLYVYRKEELEVKDLVRMILDKMYFWFKWDMEKGMDAEGMWKFMKWKYLVKWVFFFCTLVWW